MRQKDLDQVIKKISLKTFRVGCDHKNFEILLVLPTTIKEISQKFEITKMPANRRVNELEKVGLIVRDHKQGTVNPTKLTKRFISLINEINNQVKTQLPDYLA